MSKYGITLTEIRDQKYLVEALCEMGYHPQVHPQGVRLNTYYSEQEAKGYILKKREVIQTKEGQQVRLQFAVRR
jgi:hypothetical protein